MGCMQCYSTGGEVGTSSRMCHGVWKVWVHGVSAIICIPEILHVPTPPKLHDIYEISCPPQLPPPHCLQPILSLV